MIDVEPNPLLDPEAPPRFEEIKPEHVTRALRPLLSHSRLDLERIEAHPEPSWDAIGEPLTRITDRLSLAWGTVGHLMPCTSKRSAAAVPAGTGPDGTVNAVSVARRS